MPPKWRVSNIKRRLLQKDFEISSVKSINQFLLNNSFNITYMLQLFGILGALELLQERSISLNVFRVVSDEFVQYIP